MSCIGQSDEAAEGFGEARLPERIDRRSVQLLGPVRRLCGVSWLLSRDSGRGRKPP